MESDHNPFPEIEVVPSLTKLRKLTHFLFDHITNPGLSDHANRGGGPMIDRALYDHVDHPEGWGQLVLDVED